MNRILAVLSLLLTACAVTPAQRLSDSELLASAPPLGEELFGPEQAVPEFEEMIALTPEQEADFLKFFQTGRNTRIPDYRRIYSYLSRNFSDTRFIHRTIPASQSIETHAGNCMSLALVTAAYARLAGVEVGWQLANTDPVYSSEGSVIYSANHIQTRLYEAASRTNGHAFSIARDYLLLDYFSDRLPSQGIELKQHQVVALVYQNLGVEAMAAGDLERGFWLLRAGLQHDPRNPNLYNALGVVHRRAGAADSAERLYRFALEKFSDNLLILRNYRLLLQAQSRTAEVEAVERRILALPDPDPYPVIMLGDEALDNGRPDRALAYYEKARKVAPYLHEVYWKMARAHLELGNRRRAEQALEQAREKAMVDRDRQLYQAKLHALANAR